MITLRSCEKELDIRELYGFLSHLKGLYPCFSDWFFGTMLRGYCEGDRGIAIAKSGEELCGAAIVKYSESKICTLFVAPAFRGQGAGSLLFQWCFAALGTQTPFMSVKKSGGFEFQGFIERYGFRLTRATKDELFYNETKI